MSEVKEIVVMIIIIVDLKKYLVEKKIENDHDQDLDIVHQNIHVIIGHVHVHEKDDIINVLDHGKFLLSLNQNLLSLSLDLVIVVLVLDLQLVAIIVIDMILVHLCQNPMVIVIIIIVEQITMLMMMTKQHVFLKISNEV
jgi:hypothetical protein